MKKQNVYKVLVLASLILVSGAIAAQTNRKTQKKRTNKKEEKFTPPVISSDTVPNYQISIADVKGDSDCGIDIMDLKDCKIVVEEVDRDRPFTTVEQMPLFPGGDAKMRAFISDSLHYPARAIEVGAQGRVVVRFIVNREGEIIEPQIVRGFEASCNKEALRIVKAMPKWIPGRQNGQNVPVYFTLPILFRLPSE